MKDTILTVEKSPVALKKELSTLLDEASKMISYTCIPFPEVRAKLQRAEFILHLGKNIGCEWADDQKRFERIIEDVKTGYNKDFDRRIKAIANVDDAKAITEMLVDWAISLRWNVDTKKISVSRAYKCSGDEYYSWKCTDSNDYPYYEEISFSISGWKMLAESFWATTITWPKEIIKGENYSDFFSDRNCTYADLITSNEFIESICSAFSLDKFMAEPYDLFNKALDAMTAYTIDKTADSLEAVSLVKAAAEVEYHEIMRGYAQMQCGISAEIAFNLEND